MINQFLCFPYFFTLRTFSIFCIVWFRVLAHATSAPANLFTMQCNVCILMNLVLTLPPVLITAMLRIKHWYTKKKGKEITLKVLIKKSLTYLCGRNRLRLWSSHNIALIFFVIWLYCEDNNLPREDSSCSLLSELR